MSDPTPAPASRRWYQSIGPGLITACVVIGPGSILTSSKVGAANGFAMSWVVVAAVVFMMTYMMIGARLGAVAGASPGTLVADRAGRWLSVCIGIGVFFISAAFQFGNNLGVHSAVKAYVDSEGGTFAIILVVAFNALAIGFLFVFKDLYRTVERLMMCFVALMLISFAANLAFALAGMSEAREKLRTAKRSPFEAVTFEDDTPHVTFEGDAFVLVSLNEIPVTEILEFTRNHKEFKAQWKDRFARDLVHVLTEMKHPPGETVTLELRNVESGKRRTVEKAPMTHENWKLVDREFNPLLDISLLGLIGTTFVITAAFYQTYLVRQKGWGRREVENSLVDARVGAVLMALITLMIMSTAGAVLRAQYLGNVDDVAAQLAPLFGVWGRPIFCVGLFSAAYSSFLVNSMIGGFILADGLGFGSKPTNRAPKVLTTVVLLTGMGVALFVITTGVKPVPAIIAAQAVTVIASPLMAGALLWLTNRKDVMGDDRNSATVNAFAGLGFVLLVAMALYTAFVKLPETVEKWNKSRAVVKQSSQK
ncbi:MAG: NRAMP family divalent metal transporter [Planctomycetaceae bacterium]